MGEIPQPDRRRAAAFCAVALVLAGLSPGLLTCYAAGSGWRRAASPNFEVYTDAGPELARRIAVRLEQGRAAFRDASGAKRTSGLPLRVYLFAARSDFERYRPSDITEGFFQSGAETDYIVVHAENGDLGRIVIHEYVHATLHHSYASLPQWLEEGTAEFYSTLRVSGGRLTVGHAIPTHSRVLRSEAWLDAESFAAVGEAHEIPRVRLRAGVFYAQSWALAHMLYTDSGYREKTPEYLRMLAASTPDGEAFERAFGKSLSEALQDLRIYVERGVWRTLESEWTAPPELEIRSEVLSEEEAARARLDLELQLGLWDVSAESLEKLSRRRGESAEIETARALLALSRDDRAAARSHLEKAFALGGAGARAYFEYAMLLKEAEEPAERTIDYLQEAVALNPRFAEAWFVLGVELSNAGRPEKAAPALERAAEILPRQSYFWHALALAYHKTGRTEDARLAARRALEAARTGEERKMAVAAIELTEEGGKWIELKNRPEVETPRSWFNREGGARVEGTLKRVICAGERAKLVISGEDGEVSLLVADPGKVILKNAGSVSSEFACGDAGFPVAVEYVAGEDPATGTAGEVTAIELMDYGRETRQGLPTP